MSDTMSSDRNEWTIERRQPSWIGRLASPGGSGGGATNVALLVALLGAAAFVASMAMDWVTVKVPANFGQDGGLPPNGRSFGQSLVNSSTLGLVYVMTGIAVLTFVGSVITRSELALRMRLGVTGLGIGMLSIVLAGTLTVQRRILEQYGYPIFFGGPDLNDVTTALEGGLFAAYAAAVLPVAGVWIASRPAARAARETAEAAPETERRPRPATDAPAPVTEPDLMDLSRLPPSGRAGSVGGLSVSAAEPLDLSVTPDSWRA
jgi:hypothetical protein